MTPPCVSGTHPTYPPPPHRSPTPNPHPVSLLAHTHERTPLPAVLNRRAARGGRKDYKDKAVSDSDGGSDEEEEYKSEFEVQRAFMPLPDMLSPLSLAVGDAVM